MFINRLIQTIQSVKRRRYSVLAFIVTLSLTACVHPFPTAVEKVNLASKPLANPSIYSVVRVDGSIAPDDVLQVAALELNHDAVLVAGAGAVSPTGDRTVEVLNRLTQGGTKEQSTVTVLDSDANPLVSRELAWLVGPVRFSPDGSRIITSGSDRTTRIWDNQLNQIASFDGHQVLVQSLQISPDGNYILAIEYPDLIPSGQRLDQIAVARLLNLQAVQVASFEGLQSKDMQFSPDSQQLLAVSDGIVQTFDLQGNPKQTFNQNRQEFSIAQFSPDGRSVLAAGSGMMKLWDLQGQLKAEFSHWTVNPEEAISSIQLGNNGEVVTGSSTGILRFWDAQSNQLVTVKAHNGQIHAIALSPDGTKIATLGEKQANAIGDNSIRVWNRQGELLSALGENLSTSFFRGVMDQLTYSFSLQFTADGAQVVSTEMGQIGTTIRWTL